jgi:hypothetical protein
MSDEHDEITEQDVHDLKAALQSLNDGSTPMRWDKFLELLPSEALRKAVTAYNDEKPRTKTGPLFSDADIEEAKYRAMNKEKTDNEPTRMDTP